VERFEPWSYRAEAGLIDGTDVTGFDVEANDGGIGSVDEATYDVGVSYLVVDTGPWIFGKKVVIPAGVVSRVDGPGRKVYVDRSKDQIKSAPELDQFGESTPDYWDKLGGYYGDTYTEPGGVLGGTGGTYVDPEGEQRAEPPATTFRPRDMH